MIDIILVKYFNSKKDEEHFYKVCDRLSDFNLNIIIEDNTIDNIGLVKARNNAFEKSTNKVVCFMDFDVSIIDVDWDKIYDKALEPNVGVVCPAVGRKNKNEWFYGTYVHPHMMVIESDKFDKIGRFNDEFFVAYSDWDLYKRCFVNKLFIVQHGFSLIKHYGFSRSNPNKSYLWRKDRMIYNRLWEGGKRP